MGSGSSTPDIPDRGRLDQTPLPRLLLDLQRADPKGAAEKLKDALDVDSEDEDLLRLQLFADSYSKRPQDLLYLIFVKYLPTREL